MISRTACSALFPCGLSIQPDGGSSLLSQRKANLLSSATPDDGKSVQVSTVVQVKRNFAVHEGDKIVLLDEANPFSSPMLNWGSVLFPYGHVF